jgi:cytochrome oxidase assembly protein ShyY1
MTSYAFLRQPRWLALAFLVVLVVPSFLLLSRWQLSRLDQRRHYNAVVTANAHADAVPVDQVITPGGTPVGDTELWRPVTATGHYDVSRQLLVRKRPLDGENGFWVATPLVTDSGAVLIVNRGWMKATGGATATQDAPPPPTGEVMVTGRLRESEAAPPQPGDLPRGQITDLDVALVAGGAGGHVYPGYVDLLSSTPEQSGLTPIPLPDIDEGPHLSYAVQWVFFAIVAVGGFILLIRRERDYADGATHTDVA